VDAGAERWHAHPAWGGTAVRHPTEVPADWRQRCRVLVCISTLPWMPVASELMRQGWQRVQPFYDFVDAWPGRHPLNNGWRASLPGPDSSAAQRLRAVLAGWADDRSRAHHLQFLAWRCKRLEWVYGGAPVKPSERFFPPEWVACWRPGERWLDGGAHHGQVLARWLREHPGWLDQAWAVEPDADNHAALGRWHAGLPEQDRQRIGLHRFALGRRDGIRRFVQGQGYGSRVWWQASTTVMVRCLDSLRWTPSIVKLHLEGGEWAALLGAASLLTRSRPVVMATVYHRRDGLWALTDHLMRSLSGYQWLFRLHGWTGTAAVVYGMPEERIRPANSP